MRRLSCAGAPTRAVVRNSGVCARSTSAWLHGVVALAAFIGVEGCSAPPGAVPVDDDNSDVPEYSGLLPNGSGTPLPTQPGAGTPTGSAGTSGTGGTTPPPAPTNNGSEQNGANGAPLTPSQPNTGNIGM